MALVSSIKQSSATFISDSFIFEHIQIYFHTNRIQAQLHTIPNIHNLMVQERMCRLLSLARSKLLCFQKQNHHNQTNACHKLCHVLQFRKINVITYFILFYLGLEKSYWGYDVNCCKKWLAVECAGIEKKVTLKYQ